MSTLASVVLGIESSCDETAAAVLHDGREALSSVVASQEDLHARFGGIVPEVASRKHAEVITIVVDDALREAGVGWEAIDLIAVTQGPGLIGSLLVGVSAAKAYAIARGIPLVGVNHLEGHLMSPFAHREGEEALPAPEEPSLLPTLCLIVSGGHTDLVLMRAPGEYSLIGQTRDDAAGEALDKAARVLGLGYPGGPAIQRAAVGGDAAAVRFPRPIVEGTFDFSFSGLKTALIRHVEANGLEGTPGGVSDLAASFQQAVVDTLVRNTRLAAERFGARRVLVSGGVAANRLLRDQVLGLRHQLGVPVHFPPLWLCTDNAAMIACAGAYKARRNGPSDLSFGTFSSMPLAAQL